MPGEQSVARPASQVSLILAVLGGEGLGFGGSGFLGAVSVRPLPIQGCLRYVYWIFGFAIAISVVVLINNLSIFVFMSWKGSQGYHVQASV